MTTNEETTYLKQEFAKRTLRHPVLAKELGVFVTNASFNDLNKALARSILILDTLEVEYNSMVMRQFYGV